MKHILPILVLLLLPTSAYATPSGTVTDKQTGAAYTIAATDTYSATTTQEGYGYLNTATLVPQMGTTGCPYVWNTRVEWVSAGSPRQNGYCVKVGGQTIGHSYSRLRFADVPVADRYKFLPSATLIYIEYTVEGQVVQLGDVIVNNRAPFEIGSPVETYCNNYTQGWPSAPQAGVAQDATPPTVYDACAALGKFTRRASDQTETVKPPSTTVAPATIVIPASAAKCKAVGKVAVRSTAVTCASARSVIARYAKSLKSPAGWTCSAVVNDAGRRVKCAPKASKSRAVARKAVYGVWRP